MRCCAESTTGHTPSKNRGALRSLVAQLRVKLGSALKSKCGAPHLRLVVTTVLLCW